MIQLTELTGIQQTRSRNRSSSLSSLIKGSETEERSDRHIRFIQFPSIHSIFISIEFLIIWLDLLRHKDHLVCYLRLSRKEVTSRLEIRKRYQFQSRPRVEVFEVYFRTS